MSTTKKVLTIIFSILIVGAFAFVLTWGIINWSKVKDGMAGNGLYTQDDVQNAYEDGYSTALKDKEEYDKLITGYRDTITTQNDLVSQLNSEVKSLNDTSKEQQSQITTLTEQRTALQSQVDTLNTLKSNNETTIEELNGKVATLKSEVERLQADADKDSGKISQLENRINELQFVNAQLQSNNELNVQMISNLNSQIASLNSQISDLTYQIQTSANTVGTLNAKIAELQKSISYYEQYIASLENGEQVVVTFEFNGSVYNIQVVNKNDLVTVTTPQSTAYVIFNGWTVDGQKIDLSTYRITQNTRIVADVTYKYVVKFVVDGKEISSQTLLKGTFATLPQTPYKDGYAFEYWTVDGVAETNVTAMAIMQDTTFTAKFARLYTVKFMYEDSLLKTQSVKNGNTAQQVTVDSTVYKVFNGWTVNGAIVDVNTYRITADTIFAASLTYKYDVKFTVDGSIYKSQIVEKNGKPVVPNAPVKDRYSFLGWSLNGTDTVDIKNTAITQTTTFTALFKLDDLTVTFMVDGTVFETQSVRPETCPNTPDVPVKSGYEFDGWTVNGNDIVDVAAYPVTENTEFNAKFTKVYNVLFYYNDVVIDTQVIRSGSHATAPSVNASVYRFFKYWTLDGTTEIDVGTVVIESDTAFRAYIHRDLESEYPKYQIVYLSNGDALLSTGAANGGGVLYFNHITLDVNSVYTQGSKWTYKTQELKNGNVLLSSDTTDGIVLYNATSHTASKIYDKYNKYVYFVELSNGNVMITAFCDGSGVLVYNAKTMSVKQVSTLGYSWTYTELKNGNVLMGCGHATGVYLYNVSNDNVTQLYSENSSWTTMTLLSNGDVLIGNSSYLVSGFLLYNSSNNTVTKICETGGYWQFKDNGNGTATCSQMFTAKYLFHLSTRTLTEI